MGSLAHLLKYFYVLYFSHVDYVIFVRERLESLHDVVGALIMLTILRKINELQVRLFFQHSVGIDT